jgi:hypothetical protein
MHIKSKQLKISTLDDQGNEVASYLIDISDITKKNNLLESILDMSFDDFQLTCDEVSQRLCPNLCSILKKIVK